MRLIPLTQGQFAQVDDWNNDWLNQWEWFAIKDGNTYYAVRDEKKINGKRPRVWMHRVIMGTPQGMEVDHRDHNGLNCLEENMGNCTRGQNQFNKTKKRGCSSQYLGVSYNKKGYIRAQISTNKQKFYLGAFKSEVDAARAYDIKAKELFGEFANLNFK